MEPLADFHMHLFTAKTEAVVEIADVSLANEGDQDPEPLLRVLIIRLAWLAINPTAQTVDALMRLDLPAGVDVEIKQ